MDETKGLAEYVAWKPYRDSMGLPGKKAEEYKLLAQGEYNRNYLFTHPDTGKKLVLRVNFESQMHLKHQIRYEYDTLKLLRHSGRTPIPCYVDGSLEKIPHGIMVMEYLPGHWMDYRSELSCGAECLADIHSVRVGKDSHLIQPPDPVKAILEECEEMFKAYMDSGLGTAALENRIRKMLDMGWEQWKDGAAAGDYQCCVNTEVNSTNFLINGEGKGNYLVDWEKPIYGDPAQDLGHFLAPTTTFWKTDVILTQMEMETFLDSYLCRVKGRFDTKGIRERTYFYIPVTCLRGITWCAMAWTQYQHPGRELMNRSTFRKLGEYLDEGFLGHMEKMLKCGKIRRCNCN